MAEGGQLNDDIAQLAGFVLARIIGDFEGGSPAPERLLELADDQARAKLAVQLIEALAPAAPDPRIWAQWLEGGASPRAALKVDQFDPRKEASSRKIKGAAGLYSDASERTAKVRANLEMARTELAAAEQAVRDAEAEATRTAAMAQGAVIWALLRTIADTSNAIFGMRVAGPFMRAISPLPSEAERDFVTQKLDPGPSRETARGEYREQCECEYEKMVKALTFFDGDGEFQRDLRRQVLEVITWHDQNRRRDLEAKGWKSHSRDQADAPERLGEVKAWKAILDAALEARPDPAC